MVETNTYVIEKDGVVRASYVFGVGQRSRSVAALIATFRSGIKRLLPI